jgi:hypothetical protein
MFWGKLCYKHKPTQQILTDGIKTTLLYYPWESQPSYTATGPGTYKVELDVPTVLLRAK